MLHDDIGMGNDGPFRLARRPRREHDESVFRLD